VNPHREKFIIEQDGPWRIRISMLFTYSINDTLVNWRNASAYITVRVPIEGLEDPLHALRVENGSQIIRQTLVVPGKWNATLLKDHIESGYYDSGVFAPSFLYRLANATNASPYGIFNLAHPSRLKVNTTPINVSYTDYEFFNGAAAYDCTIAQSYYLYEIDGISENATYFGFRIPDSLAIRYLDNDRNISGQFTEYNLNKTRVCP
jgi:hypothetical protein